MTAPPSFPPTGGSGPASLPPTGGSGPADGGLAWSSEPPERRVRRGHRTPAVLVAIVCSAAVVALWAVFVNTRTGQVLDEAAFEGALLGQNRLWRVAEPVLDVISIPFIAGVLVTAMLLAVLRRRALLAVQVAVLVGGANLTTQVLKYVVFDRPDLDVGDTLGNALPSGHTTAATSVAAALVMVVPRRARPTVAVLGAGYAAVTGVSTLVGRWHRPSDAVAAVLVVLAWAGVASALGSRTVVVPGRENPRGVRAATVVLLVAAVGAGTVAAVALQRSLAKLDEGITSTADLLTAYGGGAMGVVAAVCGAFAVLLTMLGATEARPAREDPPPLERPGARGPDGSAATRSHLV